MIATVITRRKFAPFGADLLVFFPRCKLDIVASIRRRIVDHKASVHKLRQPASDALVGIALERKASSVDDLRIPVVSSEIVRLNHEAEEQHFGLRGNLVEILAGADGLFDYAVWHFFTSLSRSHIIPAEFAAEIVLIPSVVGHRVALGESLDSQFQLGIVMDLEMALRADADP